MRILIKNANLISVSDKRPKYEEDIDILINDDRIERIDKNIQEVCDKVIDAKGKVVMPGLINAHAHVPMSLYRESVDGYTLQDWLTDYIWPSEDKLTESDVYYGSMLTFIEMIKSGTTMINDMYFITEGIIKAAKEMGVRIETSRTLMSMGLSPEERMRELQELIYKYKNEELITFNAGIHGLYTVKENDLIKYLDFTKKNNINVHMHFCENDKEVKDIYDSYKMMPTDIVMKYFKDFKSILAHAVIVNDEDISRLSQLNTSIVHSPISNLKLGCGIAPVIKMLKNNINVCLGTDGQGSGSNVDMFELMKFTGLLQKGVNKKPELLDAYDIIKMATINGAKALGMEDKIGSIDISKKADIIIIDMEHVKAKPLNNVFATIVYNTCASNVDTTIINGKILMENKKLVYQNEKDIYDKCEEIIKRIS